MELVNRRLEWDPAVIAVNMYYGGAPNTFTVFDWALFFGPSCT